MKCISPGICRGHCSTPWQCGLSTRMTQSNGGESVNLEHEPMRVDFAGAEPVALPHWLKAFLLAAVIVLAFIGVGALRSYFFY